MLTNASLILAFFIASSLPIAATLIVTALILSFIYSPLPLFLAASEIFWKVSTEFTLTSVPLFVLLGELLLRSGIAQRMYGAVALWLNRLPGGLLHANIGASTLFSATSGSSVATAATIGTVALPEIRRRGYNERLFLGSLAAGGTLGILIPPSIHLIIYGMITNTSVPKLYLAATIPGLLLAALFSLLIVVICALKPGYGGERIEASWGQRFACLVDLVPILLLFVVVIGSIYTGFATPTEAASLGLVFALGLTWWYGRLSLALLHECFIGAMKATAMIMLIVLASYFLNFVLSVIGLSQQLTTFISGLGLSPLQTMLVIIAFFVVLGCFLESLSMLVTITPLVAPIVIGLGYDPIWFGVILIILLEVALITPPVGINLYVVQAIRGRGSIQDVIAGSLIFVFSMFALIGLLLAVPEIVLWLPMKFSE